MFRTIAAIAIVLATISTAEAQDDRLVGSWRGVVYANGYPITINLILQPDKRFTEQEVSNVGMTMQTGAYIVVGDQLTLSIEDWQPKTQAVYHPTGAVGGYYSQEPTAKPPGGTYQCQFLSRDAFIMRDVAFNGEMRFDRAR